MVEWHFSDTLVPYPDALETMENRVNGIVKGSADEAVWMLEHPSLYTGGTSAKDADLIAPDKFPVFSAKRGGEYTYHGPGQRIAYAMLNLNTRGRDIRAYVFSLEEWVIRTLAEFGIVGERRNGRVGVWVIRKDKSPDNDGDYPEDKIAAIGVRVRKWVTYHGISINLDPDLSHYDGIIPCGIAGHGVTSFADLGLTTSMTDLDIALRQSFHSVFGD